MDQNQNRQLPVFLKHLLNHPFAAGATDVPALLDLVRKYPACSIFHLLLAKASEKLDHKQAATALNTAAAYAPNRQILYDLMFSPETLKAPGRENFYPFSEEEKAAVNGFDFLEEEKVSVEGELEKHQNDDEAAADASFIGIKPESLPEDILVAENNVDAPETIVEPEIVSAETIILQEIVIPQEISAAEIKIVEGPDEEAIINENEQLVEDVNLHFINEPENEVVFAEENAASEDQPDPEVNTPAECEDLSSPQGIKISHNVDNEIDEEVYDEIVAIEDIRLEPIAVKTGEVRETPQTAENEKDTVKEALNRLPEIRDEADKTMLSSIASIDYFTFNNKFGQPAPAEDIAEKLIEAVATPAPEEKETPAEKPSAALIIKEPETVSNYHDDTLPYTFTWWLHKMRKQYAGTYQPYLPKTADKNSMQTPELQQQYIESIFQSKPSHELVEIDVPANPQPPVARKEDDLIRRFIVEEPHIHPPSSDKLDTENKAKKSAEDADALVTETLAKVYLDQMLYHKALDTYKKLLLKFPEKKLYFADQIESIEKKIN